MRFDPNLALVLALYPGLCWPASLRFDPNFPAMQDLEWLVEDPANVVVTGMLLRELGRDVDPRIYGDAASLVTAGANGPEHAGDADLCSSPNLETTESGGGIGLGGGAADRANMQKFVNILLSSLGACESKYFTSAQLAGQPIGDLRRDG